MTLPLDLVLAVKMSSLFQMLTTEFNSIFTLIFSYLFLSMFMLSLAEMGKNKDLLVVS